MSTLKKILLAISFSIVFLIASQIFGFSYSIPFETIGKGQISYYRYNDPDFFGADMVMKDLKTWEWFWSEHTNGTQPPPSIPRVDFRREIVLVVILGLQTSGGGPSIEIVSVEEFGPPNISAIASSGSIKVVVEENREPGPLDVVTNPYHIVKIRGNYASILFEREPVQEPKPCKDNSGCAQNEYCEKELGNCDGTGGCKAKPLACPNIYAPVCGCDGKTYSSECVVAMAGVSILHQGPCGTVIPCMKNEDCNATQFCLFPDGKCTGPGNCTLRPNVCPLFFLLVCGCDMKTYGNQCEAYRSGVSILHTGPCAE